MKSRCFLSLLAAVCADVQPGEYDAFSEDVQKTMEAGMDAHISKPVDMAQLAQTMRTFVTSAPGDACLQAEDSGR